MPMSTYDLSLLYSRSPPAPAAPAPGDPDVITLRGAWTNHPVIIILIVRSPQRINFQGSRQLIHDFFQFSRQYQWGNLLSTGRLFVLYSHWLFSPGSISVQQHSISRDATENPMARPAVGSRSGMDEYELHDHLSEKLSRAIGNYFANFSSSVSRISQKI